VAAGGRCLCTFGGDSFWESAGRDSLDLADSVSSASFRLRRGLAGSGAGDGSGGGQDSLDNRMKFETRAVLTETVRCLAFVSHEGLDFLRCPQHLHKAAPIINILD
jgi:hypothetical protein